MTTVTPAGHLAITVPHTYMAGSPSDLECAFKEWCSSGKSYRKAHDFLSEIRPSVEDLHSLMLNYANQTTEIRKHDKTGNFLTAGYRLSDEKIIVYDLDVPLGLGGHHLPEEKLFIVTGRLGFCTGNAAIVNLGHINSMFAPSSRGLLVNAGAVDKFYARQSVGEATSFFLHKPRDTSFIIHSSKLSKPPKVNIATGKTRGYLEELARICAGTTDDIHERYGPVPAFQIKKDIRKLVEEHQ